MRISTYADWKAQQKTPYLSALMNVASSLRYRLQAPGHGGRLPRPIAELLRHAARHDLSVAYGLDVAPAGELSQLALAEQLTAKAVGAQACAFFTTGASMVVYALAGALMDTMPHGRILVPQNAHVSLFNALQQAKARITILPVEVHKELGMTTVLDLALLEAELAKGDVAGVFITRGYLGLDGPMLKYIAACKRAGVPIIVDNSWASELPFSHHLGPSPIQMGADAEVGSPHKSLHTLGQTAWALLGPDSLIPLHIFEQAMARYKSTSKSSLMIAALDECRKQAYFNTDAGILKNLRAIEKYARRWLPPGMLVDWEQERREGRTIAESSIPYRMTLRTWKTGYTGYELATMLREQYGVQVALPSVLYMFVGVGVDNPKAIKAMFKALGKLLRKLPHRDELNPADMPQPTLTRADIDFSTARGKITPVPIEEAEGKVLAQVLACYPPGAPIRVFGQVLRREDIDFLLAMQAKGAKLFGGSETEMAAGRVMVYERRPSPAKRPASTRRPAKRRPSRPSRSTKAAPELVSA